MDKQCAFLFYQGSCIMQEPQLLGILIGVFFILFGVFIKRHLIKKEKNVLGGVLFTIFIYIGVLSILQNTFFSYLPTWEWAGVIMAWSDMLGRYTGFIILSLVGLLYKPNKVAGYTTTLIVITALYIFN